MIRVYHTPVTNPSSTDTASTTASTAVTESVICWTCLGLTVSTAGKYMITCCTGKMGIPLSVIRTYVVTYIGIGLYKVYDIIMITIPVTNTGLVCCL